MQLGLLPDEEPFRASASEWLPRELEGPVADIRGLRTLTAMAERRRDWEKRLGEAGWFCIAWPREYGGRDASLVQQVLFAEEYARLGPPPRLNHIRVELAGPTILAFGTEDQKSRFLPAIASGDKIWCQGYSEPNTGSDLAGTEATLDPGECGVDGQKVCTSLVEHSEWIFIVAGSEAGTAGLNGLSFPLLRVEQPRAAVPPTRQMKGECELKETFLDTARTNRANVLREPGKGWRAAMSPLHVEGGVSTLPPQVASRRELDAVIGAARTNGIARPPLIRQESARGDTDMSLMRYCYLTSYPPCELVTAAGRET